MERYFNTAGPCIPAKHYMLPALDRLPGIRRLVNMERYFVIHAPRQTGKTTAVKALVREINEKDDMVALYCSLETLQGAADVDNAMPKLRRLLIRSASAGSGLVDPAEQDGPVCVQETGWTVSAVSETLTALCRRARRC